jgi:hypothetical protein
MRLIKTILFSLMLVIIPSLIFAQGKGGSQMGELMRSSGRIYVVVAVMVTILLGLFLYLIRLDRKIGKLEREGR